MPAAINPAIDGFEASRVGPLNWPAFVGRLFCEP